jgi:hypothetical protein
MSKRFLFALGVLAAFAFGACSDSIYYTISKEVVQVEPRIKGGPANFAIFNDYMYAASGSKLLRYRKEVWDENIPQPGGRIKMLATAGNALYALCYNDENLSSSTALRRFDGAGWRDISGNTGGYNTFQSIYPANGELFIGAERNDSFAILHVDRDIINLVAVTGLRAMLCGAAYYGTEYYLCTEGHVRNNDKTGGIFTFNASFSLVQAPIPNTQGVHFSGIINLANSVAAIDRNGNLYAVTAQGISDSIASLGRESTGALAVWRDVSDAPTLLLAGRGALVEGYTYGYMELDFTKDVSSWYFKEPGESFPSSIRDFNKELYISTIGKESLTHLFQAPLGVDDNMTLFASTQKNGVWSYKERDGKLQWNAEK